MRNFLRIAASITLTLLVVVANAFDTTTWREVLEEFTAAKSEKAAVESLKSWIDEDDEDYDRFNGLVESFEIAQTKEDKTKSYQNLLNYLKIAAISEEYKRSASAKSVALKIKKQPIYKVEKSSSSATWLEELAKRLNGDDKNEVDNQSSIPQFPGWLVSFLQVIFYLFVAAMVATLLYVVYKLVTVGYEGIGRRKSRKGKATGLLEEGEELLSEDEYLAKADKLVAEGRFREACRALYLATLLRLDTARIARFEPAETNWEHLRRIEKSSRLPQGFVFRSVTQAFDNAWYGYQATSAEHVDIFRRTYVDLKELTKVNP